MRYSSKKQMCNLKSKETQKTTIQQMIKLSRNSMNGPTWLTSTITILKIKKRSNRTRVKDISQLRLCSPKTINLARIAQPSNSQKTWMSMTLTLAERMQTLNKMDLRCTMWKEFGDRCQSESQLSERIRACQLPSLMDSKFRRHLGVNQLEFQLLPLWRLEWQIGVHSRDNKTLAAALNSNSSDKILNPVKDSRQHQMANRLLLLRNDLLVSRNSWLV